MQNSTTDIAKKINLSDLLDVREQALLAYTEAERPKSTAPSPRVSVRRAIMSATKSCAKSITADSRRPRASPWTKHFGFSL